ncbi:hypothetical protein ABK040_009620 [Willaertia magna]
MISNNSTANKQLLQQSEKRKFSSSKQQQQEQLLTTKKKMKETNLGQIRVGRRIYNKSKFNDPSYPNFTPIIVMTKSTDYGAIGPYCLKNEKGQIMENIWQFSKIYETVPKAKEYYSRFDKTIIWQHPEEVHFKDNKPTKEYWLWREKGYNNKYPVRYPIGFKRQKGGNSKCVGAIYNEVDIDSNDKEFNYEGKILNYIEARKAIYLPVYCNLVKEENQFKELKKRLENGENLLIIEVDGPHEEDLDYYKEKYQVEDNFIEKNTIVVNEENMKIMLNDSKHPFGHGYCLGLALLGLDKVIVTL